MTEEVVEWSQQCHPLLPHVRTHRFKELDVLVMDVPLVPTIKPYDVNSMYHRFLLQAFQIALQVKIAASRKIEVNFPRGGCAKGSNGPLGDLMFEFVSGHVPLLHPGGEELFSSAPEIL